MGEDWGVGVRDAGVSLSRSPQASQNLRSAGLGRAQVGHARSAESAAPHTPQNVASSRFSVAHDGQSTALAPQLRGPPVSVPVFE